MKNIELVTPGEILLEEFLIPLKISMASLAAAIKVPPNRITQIIKNQREISPDTAVRFGRFFNTTPEFWLTLQTHYNLEKLLRDEGHQFDEISQFQASPTLSQKKVA